MKAAGRVWLSLALAACSKGSHGSSSAPEATGGAPAPSALRLDATTAAADPADAMPDATQETNVTKAAVLASTDDYFEYRTGNPDFRGRTTVHVAGDGKAKASLERGGKTQEYTGTVTPALLKQLRDALTAHPIESFKAPTRNPVPDETTIELEVVAGGQRQTNEILSGERSNNEALDDLVEIVQTIASKVSGGKVQY